jgi:hypothetical protein
MCGEKGDYMKIKSVRRRGPRVAIDVAGERQVYLGFGDKAAAIRFVDALRKDDPELKNVISVILRSPS